MSSSVGFKVSRDMAMWIKPFNGPIVVMTIVSQREFIHQPAL